MLGKLIKYEFKATARWILPLFGGVIFLSIVNKLMMLLFGDDHLFLKESSPFSVFRDIAFSLTIMLYVMMIIAAFTITFVLMLRRFQSNLMGDEGYLMFTLPVSVHQHMIAKLLTASLWTFGSFIATFLSIFILTLGAQWPSIAELIEVLQREFPTNFFAHSIGFFFEFALMMLFSVPMMFLSFYVAIAFAYTRQKHKLLYGIAAYMGLNVVSQVVGSITLLFLNAAFLKDFSYTVNALVFNTSGLAYLHAIFIVSTIEVIVFGVLYYFATHYLLSKKLNME